MPIAVEILVQCMFGNKDDRRAKQQFHRIDERLVQQDPLKLRETRIEVASAGTEPDVTIYVPWKVRWVRGYSISAFAKSSNVLRAKDGRKVRVPFVVKIICVAHVTAISPKSFVTR